MSTKVPQYVVKFSKEFNQYPYIERYHVDRGGGTLTPNLHATPGAYPGGACRFDSATQAASVARAWLAGDFKWITSGTVEIIRLDETPGTPTYQEVALKDMRAGDAYAFKSYHIAPARWVQQIGRHANGYAESYTPENATPQTFATLMGAVKAYAELARTMKTPIDWRMEIHGVRTIPGTPTVTETVVETITLVPKPAQPAPPRREVLTYRTPESSAIYQIAYDVKARVAQVTMAREWTPGDGHSFINLGPQAAPKPRFAGQSYEYQNVSAEDVMLFLAAKSKGAFYNQTWKPKYGSAATKRVEDARR